MGMVDYKHKPVQAVHSPKPLEAGSHLLKKLQKLSNPYSDPCRCKLRYAFQGLPPVD